MAEPQQTLAFPALDAVEALEEWMTSATIGLAFLDREHRFVRINAALAQIDGLPVDAHLGRRVGDLLPGLAAQLEPLLDRVLTCGEPITDVLVRGRTAASEGSDREWSASYLPLRDADGGVCAVAAIVTELGDKVQAQDLRLSREHLRLALEGTQTGTWVWDVKADEVRWSDNLGPLHGLGRGEQPPTYEAYLATMHPGDRERIGAAVQAALEEGSGYELELRSRTAEGEERWVLAKAHVITDDDGTPSAIVGLTTDVTERRRREDARAFLAEAGAALTGLQDPVRALEEVARLAVPRLADWCVVQLVDEHGRIEDIAVAHADPEKARWAGELQARWPPDPTATSGAPEVIRTGRAELYPEIADELLVAGAQDEEHLNLLRALHIRSAMIVPLVARDRRLGAITFVAAESGRQYGGLDLELAEELGRRAGLAVDHARLFEREHTAAETLQLALLPVALPQIPGYELAVRYLPGMRGAAAGGDWYDAFLLGDGRCGVVVGDIVGRGIPAAATMGKVRNALRAYAVYAEGPAQAIDQLYGMTDLFGDVPFATVLYLTVDPPTGRASYAAAGHPPPLLVSAGGEARYLESTGGPPLGSVRPASCPQQDGQLEPGDVLVLYTDGLIEEPSRPLDDGFELLKRAASGPSASLETLADTIIAELSGARAPQDDIALLALRRVG